MTSHDNQPDHSTAPNDERIAASNGRAATVVVGISGSDRSWRAAAYAIGMARRMNAHVVFVHVERAARGGLFQPELMALSRDVEEGLSHAIQRELAAHCRLEPISWEVVVRRGPTALALRILAIDRGADAVLVGVTKRRNPLSWSTSARLTRKGHWPVIAVP